MPAGAVGLRQDDDAARDRGAGAAGAGTDRGRRAGAGGRERIGAAAGAPHRVPVPGLRAVSAPHGGAERRLRDDAPAEGDRRGAGGIAARPDPPETPRGRLPPHAVGRRAAAGGAGPRARLPPPRGAAGRAVLEPRRLAPRRAPGGDDPHPQGRRRHRADGHPRPGGGAGHGRPDRADARRQGGADRHAGRALLAAGRRLHGGVLRRGQPAPRQGGAGRDPHRTRRAPQPRLPGRRPG